MAEQQQSDITELAQATPTPAAIDFDYEALDRALEDRLANYETVVTEDTVKPAKEARADINKLKKALADARKAAAGEARAPIEEFEAQIKEREQRCADAAKAIDEQVKQFEDRRREEIRQTLETELARLWNKNEVQEEHCRAQIDDLVTLDALTKSGDLAKKVRQPLEERVAADRARQDKVEKRLLELEARSYRAGLSAPLSRDHVAQYLEADDETYEAELQRILDAEIDREKQATERRRQEWEREQEQERKRQQEEAERQERIRREEEAEASPKETGHPPFRDQEEQEQPVPDGEPTYGEPPETGSTPDPLPDDDGKVTWTVTATFEIRVKPGVSQEAIEAQGRKVFEDAGIKTLQAVSATPKKGKEAA